MLLPTSTSATQRRSACSNVPVSLAKAWCGRCRSRTDDASTRRCSRCFPTNDLVLVSPAEPKPSLVASQRRAVEPLVHAPEPVQPAGVGRVGVVDDAVL